MTRTGKPSALNPFVLPESVEIRTDSAQPHAFDINDTVTWELPPLSGLTGAAAKPPAVSADPLTAREWQIARLAARGDSSSRIAEKLFISVATVRKHRENLMRKLDLHTVQELVAWLFRHDPPTRHPDKR